MKTRKTEIPTKSLVSQYLPADYKDAFVCEMNITSQLTPDDIMVRFWTDFPAWIIALFKIRNFVVRFVGLKSSENDAQKLENCIRTDEKHSIASVPAKDENETILLLDDEHLDAYLSVYIENLPNQKTVYAVTLVHYKKTLGRIYFFFIRPFHGLIVRSALKRIVK